MLLDPTIPVSERNRVTAGSRERAQQALEALVVLTGAERTGVAAKHEIVATFSDHLIVEADQKLYKFPFFQTEGGFTLGAAEPVFVQRVSRKQMVEDTMYGVVDALLTDRVDEAAGLVRQLVPHLGEAKELLAYADAPKRVGALLDRDCKWKAVVVENAVKAGALVPEAVPHFGKLYDGSMKHSEIAGFDELVRSEFGEQVAELETLWQTVESLEAVLKLMSGSEATANVNLVEDYKHDLAEVRSALSDVGHQIQDAAILGRISDAVAAALPKHRALCSHLQLQISR
jgi:hypothetical protein